MATEIELKQIGVKIFKLFDKYHLTFEEGNAVANSILYGITQAKTKAFIKK